MTDELDWKEVGRCVLHADFIESTHQTWDRLFSRCLLVTGLPDDYTEITSLREFFSVVTSPVYCQVGGLLSCGTVLSIHLADIAIMLNLWSMLCS